MQILNIYNSAVFFLTNKKTSQIASGNPVPSITWTKTSGLGVSKSRLGEGPILTLEKVDRQHAGVYQCVAENHVGEPVSIDMRVDVLCEFPFMFCFRF